MRRVPNARSPYQSNLIGGASFSIGDIDANVIVVSVQLKDQSGADLAVRGHVDWYLSSDAHGDAVASALSGGVAAGTDGVVISTTTGKAGWAVSEADGDIDFAMTDSGNGTVYLNLRMPDGSLVTSGAISFQEPGTA